MLNKKFTIHLDAIIVITLLFLASIAFNAFQHQQISQITAENLELQMQAQVDKMNLESQQVVIDRLSKEK
ncbi:hypothetical protein [Gallaecimonas sp. GXIMD4217]|uniref:hypothetical protein n=1 Tax=Gallaecimonas sp. GXIMD4217 TaxID=3131927 RepID=UPI00311AD375